MGQFRAYSLLPYLIVIIVLYFVILPSIEDSLSTIVCIYSLVLTTSSFLSINALSPHKSLKHERFNCYATLLFLFSDCLVIAKEIELIPANVSTVLMQNVIMISYYAAQLLFANGAYNRYRYEKTMLKRQ